MKRKVAGMRIDVYVHFVDLTATLEKIMASQAELAAELTALKDQVVKSRAEVLKKIGDLEAALANAGSTTPEVDAALAALKQEVQTTDDIVPDAPTP